MFAVGSIIGFVQSYGSRQSKNLCVTHTTVLKKNDFDWFLWFASARSALRQRRARRPTPPTDPIDSEIGFSQRFRFPVAMNQSTTVPVVETKSMTSIHPDPIQSIESISIDRRSIHKD